MKIAILSMIISIAMFGTMAKAVFSPAAEIINLLENNKDKFCRKSAGTLITGTLIKSIRMNNGKLCAKGVNCYKNLGCTTEELGAALATKTCAYYKDFSGSQCAINAEKVIPSKEVHEAKMKTTAQIINENVQSLDKLAATCQFISDILPDIAYKCQNIIDKYNKI